MLIEETDKTERHTLPLGVAIAFVVAFVGLTYVRSAGWVPPSWSFLPIIASSWLSFVLVLAVMAWMKVQGIPLAHVGLTALPPPGWLLKWVAGTMAVDTLAIGIATPALVAAFGETQPVARFEDLPGNLPLLLTILPLVWLFAGLGEEFFFRGFLLTTIAEALGASRPAWIAAVVLQAVGFGLLHAYQGPVQAVSIGIGGAVYGGAFLLAKRNLWPVILAHAINNTLGLVLLYSGAIVR